MILPGWKTCCRIFKKPVICCRTSTMRFVDLERSPDDHRLLNEIFRGFHTIKGGAGFLNAVELVKLCHLTENLFDKLRNAEMTLTPALMDTIMAATQGMRNMFAVIAQGRQPEPAPAWTWRLPRAALEGIRGEARFSGSHAGDRDATTDARADGQRSSRGP